MADIKHILSISAPADKVYEALTTREGIAGWWTPDAELEPQVNSIARFNFGREFQNKMRITGLQPGKCVHWRCLEGHDEWIGTSFRFDLEAQEGNTLLRFGHTNWREETDFFASCNYNWGWYLTSLKNYCETGTGQPYTG